jgi:hypothetical protein
MDILATVKLGGGKIDITEARIRSSSFEGRCVGSIPIASDLMQSPLNLPVDVALSRSLSQKARLMPSDTPTNVAYVPIPSIASVKGTLGAPAPDVDRVKTGLLMAQGLAGLVTGRTGDTLSGVVGLVGGAAKGGTNAVGNLIQGLGGLFGGKNPPGAVATPSAAPATNATVAKPATNTVAPTGSGGKATNSAASLIATNGPVADLLKGLLGTEKKKQ